MVQAEEILAQARGFTRSRVILSAADLDFFTRLDDKPSTAAELARKSGCDLRAATRVLDCLVTFGFLRKENQHYHNTEAGALLSARHPETVLPMVLHMSTIWENWSHLTETVKEGKNPARRTVTEWEGEAQRAFIGAMHVAGRELSREIAGAYDLSRFQRLLDIGGASGTYTIAFLRENPEMAATIFDLKEVIPLAAERLADEGLLDRVSLVAGDFYRDELPQGCDLALLSAIIHQNSPQENLDLYRKIHRALLPGGTLLIRDHIMDEARLDPPAGAMFAINMLVNTRGGDTYTFLEVKETLEAAGFGEVKWVRSGERMDSLVEARKPH
ncbi:MAG: methyltransferase [Thermodesulfobacteriota bacterium]